MIIHLTGADSYRSARRLAELRSAFIAKHDPKGFNTVTLDGAALKPGEVKNALSATGFFASKRFVAIDRFDPTGEISAEQLGELLEPIAAPKHDVIVVVRDELDDTKTPTRTKKKTTGKKKAAVQFALPQEKRELFPRLTPVQAAAWVVKETAARTGKIAPEAAQRLVALCGGDSWRIANELEKLLLYSGSEPISVPTVETMVRGEVSGDIFALTDALGLRQTAQALRLLHRELEAGTNPFGLLATLASHIRNLRNVQIAVAQGLSPAGISSALALHPFVVQKAIAQSKHFSGEELRRLHHQLLFIDSTLKTSPLDAETLLNVMMVAA